MKAIEKGTKKSADLSSKAIINCSKCGFSYKIGLSHDCLSTILECLFISEKRQIHLEEELETLKEKYEKLKADFELLKN